LQFTRTSINIHRGKKRAIFTIQLNDSVVCKLIKNYTVQLKKRSYKHVLKKGFSD
jgi:hypothetical protein